MIEHEAGGVGIETDEVPSLYDSVPGVGSHVIRADGARPETISAMCRAKSAQSGKKFRVTAADKWPGSVEDGITHLRSYDQIVIHPRCRKTIAEAGKWSYKVDKLTGDALPVLAPGHDHYWDAIRYALGPMIRAPKQSGIFV
jgi:phage terminase large subunit